MSRAVASGKVGVRACPSGLTAGTYSIVASSSSMSLSACFSISLSSRGNDSVVNERIPSREAKETSPTAGASLRRRKGSGVPSLTGRGSGLRPSRPAG